jgi:fructose-1-phosphate kinase PfkB-like protein
MPARVWCFTPNPVFETKIESPGGRAVLSAGGKAHNVARQLHCWGVPAFSVVSKPGPDWLQAARRDRVPLRKVPIRSAARTGWAVVEAAGRRLDFFTEDPRWKSWDWNRCGLFLRRMVRSGDWLVVAGSVPSGARPGWWRTLFLGLRKKRVRILVDGKGQLLREAMQAGVEWAKANLAEAEETMQKKGASRCLEAMRNLSCGRSCLSITQGSRGLVLQAGKQRFPGRAPKIHLLDATGSGDVASAALIYGIRKGWEIEKVAGFAVWAGSEKAARRDAVVRRLKG